MSVNVYFLRVVKYLLKMVVLLSAVFILMLATGTAEVSPEAFIANLFNSTRGAILLIALLAVALTYPKFGYVKRTITIDYNQYKEEIIAFINKSGYSLYSEKNGEIIFRATSPFKRVIMLGDDKIVLKKEMNSITIEGLRKDIAMTEYRLKSLSLRE